jgi:pimeloyl-ACP methyl ester carboxylesterase
MRGLRDLGILGLCLLLYGCTETGRPTTTAPAVSFATDDGLTLRGHLFGTGDSWVILSHMFPDDQTAWFPFAGELAGRGYHVLTFDFRGYGESDGQKQIDRIDHDLTAAVGYVRRQHPKRLTLLGASMGGTASVIIASQGQVDGVITLSAPITFRGLDASGLSLQMPALFISSELDDDNQLSAQALYDIAGPDRAIDIVPGPAHGIGLLSSSQAPQVRADIFKFLDRYAPLR